MAFGALVGGALGLAGSIYGANSASKTADADRAQAAYEAKMARQQAAAEMSMTMQDRRDRLEENAYQRVMNSMNRGIRGQERQFQLDELQDYKRTLLAERSEDIRRQVMEDRNAARERQFQIRQLLQNQDLSAEEREYAIEQLERAQQIAEGEREEELIRFYEDRAEKEIERDFYVQQMQMARGDFQSERQDDFDFRNEIIRRIDGVGGAVQAAYDELDYVPRMRTVNAEDIDREAARREADYTADVDRAGKLVASINEADLIRGGIDVSSTGTARRADVAARLSQQYSDASRRAYDEAVDYISGKTNAINSNIAGLMDQQDQRLAQVAGVANQGMQYLNAIPGVSSATGAYNLLSGTPTGILDRQISSAGSYRSPVNIGSAIYDKNITNSGLASYMRPGTTADTQGFNINTAIYDPYNAVLGTTMVGNPMAAYTANANNANSMARASASNAALAGRAVGTSFNKFFNDNISGRLDDYAAGKAEEAGGKGFWSWW